MTHPIPQRPSELALVTGATSGLGRGVACALADSGWTVLVQGRDKRRCDEVVAELTGRGASAFPYTADLASLAQTTELAHRIASEHPSLGLLVNNAGAGFGANPRLREVSQDGYELRLAVNYLAPVTLTGLLRAPLRAAGTAQVVNVGSVGQSPLIFDDPQFTRGYEGSEAYMRSKFALAAWTFAVANAFREDGIRVNCLHPGTYLDTGMTQEAGITPWTPVREGIDAVLNAIGVGQGGSTGLFLNGTRKSRAHARTYDADVQESLSSLTTKLLSRVEGAEEAAW